MAVEVLELGFDCHACDEVLRKERGCETEGIVPFYLDEERYFRCPLKLISQVSWEYVRAYQLYQKGKLPNGDAWLNESQKYLDAMKVLENEINRREIEQIKRKK